VKRDFKLWLSAAVLGASIVAGYATLRAQVTTTATEFHEFRTEYRDDTLHMQKSILDLQLANARMEVLLEGRK